MFGEVSASRRCSVAAPFGIASKQYFHDKSLLKLKQQQVKIILNVWRGANFTEDMKMRCNVITFCGRGSALCVVGVGVLFRDRRQES